MNPRWTNPLIKTKELWKPGKLAKDTFVLSAGLGLRTMVQTAVFFIVVRVLGSECYGAFSAVIALAGVWVNFCGFGVHVLLIRDVARDYRNFPQSWGLTLSALALAILPMLFVYVISAWWLLAKVSWPLVLRLGLGELVFWPFVNAVACAYQGFERMGRSARIMLVPVLFRLIAAVLLLVMVAWRPSAERLAMWSWFYVVASLLAAGYACYRVLSDLGRPIWPNFGLLRSYIVQGLPFSLWGSANKLYVDADKFLLAGLASLEIAGVYSAGYRFVDLTFMPLYAFLGSAAPRLFRAVGEGRSSAWEVSMPLLWPSLFYAIGIGIALTLSAPLVPYIMGQGYQDATVEVRWLAWLPLISLPRLLVNQVLAASGAQAWAMIVMLGGGLLNIGLNIWLIPLYGWKGAIVATYGAEVGMAVLLLLRK